MARTSRSTVRARSTRLGAMIAFLFLGAATGCGDDDGNPMGNGNGNGNGNGGTTIPASWAGVWSTTTIIRDCSTGAVFSETTELDTLCAGESFEFEGDASSEIPCTGTVTDTSFNVSCSGTVTDAGCTQTFAVTWSGTRNGDSYTSTGEVTSTFSGAECPFEGTFCTGLEVNGTRVSTDQSGCGS